MQRDPQKTERSIAEEDLSPPREGPLTEAVQGAPPPAAEALQAAAPPPDSSRVVTQHVARRGDGFTDRELDGLLSLLKEKLPLGRDEWEIVAHMHNEVFPGHGRVADSLKRKFSKLYRTRVPTGNPHIPAPVKRAKRIREEMIERADMGDGDATQTITSVFGAPAAAAILSDQTVNNNASVVTAHSPPPRPLVLGRSDIRHHAEDNGDTSIATDDLVSTLRLAIQLEQEQRQTDREEDARRREQEQHEREMDRAVAQRNHDELMRVLVAVLSQHTSQGISQRADNPQ